MMGISKRELMEDYYIDELSAVMEQWGRLHKPETSKEQTDPMTFFGGGGEWVE